MHMGSRLVLVDVRRDDHPSASHFRPNQLRLQAFPLGDIVHFLGDMALSGVMNLRAKSDRAARDATHACLILP